MTKVMVICDTNWLLPWLRMHCVFDQFTHHLHKERVFSHRLCPDEIDAELLAELSGFCFEIVNDFHMIEEEAYRLDDHIIHFLSLEHPQMIANVRLEPGLCRRPTATLEDELPVRI